MDKNLPLSEDPVLFQAIRGLQAREDADKHFRVIDDRLRPRLLAYFQAQHFSMHESEELVQNTLIRVYLGISNLKDESKFLAWLFAIARNVRLTALERREREKRQVAGGLELLENLPDPRSGAADRSSDEEKSEARLMKLRAAIGKLPRQQRQCLLLRIDDMLSYEEIARTLNLSANTIRNHLASAKKRLLQFIQLNDSEDFEL